MKKRQVKVKPKRRTSLSGVKLSTTSAPPVPPPVALEQRLISEMPFGYNKCVVDPALQPGQSKTWEPSAAQIEEQTWVRNYLEDAGCVMASDIEKLGCTGVVKREVEASMQDEETRHKAAVTSGTRLRLGLAGSGVGLPCFVPSTRFCLIHNTIGGLERGQEQHHTDYVELISRALTAEEEAKTIVMQAASKMKSVGELNDLVAGRSPLDVDGDDEAPYRSTSAVRPKPWKCPEHEETVWSCRYCLAQAIVEGSLDPVLAVSSGRGGVAAEGQVLGERTAGTGMTTVLDVCSQRGDDTTEVFVRAALFTRKLARS